MHLIGSSQTNTRLHGNCVCVTLKWLHFPGCLFSPLLPFFLCLSSWVLAKIFRNCRKFKRKNDKFLLTAHTVQEKHWNICWIFFKWLNFFLCSGRIYPSRMHFNVQRWLAFDSTSWPLFSNLLTEHSDTACPRLFWRCPSRQWSSYLPRTSDSPGPWVKFKPQDASGDTYGKLPPVACVCVTIWVRVGVCRVQGTGAVTVQCQGHTHSPSRESYRQAKYTARTALEAKMDISYFGHRKIRCNLPSFTLGQL